MYSNPCSHPIKDIISGGGQEFNVENVNKYDNDRRL